MENPKEERKQETTSIEEAAKTYYEENIDQSNIPREHYEWEIQDLMIGFCAQWQAEQDKNKYSEEDLREAFFSGCQSERQIKPRIDCWKEWFKQFKKK